MFGGLRASRSLQLQTGLLTPKFSRLWEGRWGQVDTRNGGVGSRSGTAGGRRARRKLDADLRSGRISISYRTKYKYTLQIEVLAVLRFLGFTLRTFFPFTITSEGPAWQSRAMEDASLLSALFPVRTMSKLRLALSKSLADRGLFAESTRTKCCRRLYIMHETRIRFCPDRLSLRMRLPKQSWRWGERAPEPTPC